MRNQHSCHSILNDSTVRFHSERNLSRDEFKISPDPQLFAQIRDIVGLYMNPPVNAAVFAVDEKPQIQALNRTAPMLPMMPTTTQGARMNTNATAPSTCSPRSISRPAR